MAITTFAGYKAAKKQRPFVQRNSLTSISGGYFSTFGQGNIPAAGTLAAGNTANGLVHTDAIAGYPVISAFDGSNKGYLTGVDWNISNATRFNIYDRLFVAGAYAFNDAVTLASQPSYSSRIPGGTDYNSLEIWFECVTAFTGIPTITVTYTNEAGTTGRTTGAFSTGVAPIVGRCFMLPLQAGDEGVQKIESVTATVATVGTFNIMVLRPLYMGRTIRATERYSENYIRTGFTEVFADSAFYTLCATDGSATGTINYQLEITNG